jgi:hypothetical protein
MPGTGSVPSSWGVVEGPLVEQPCTASVSDAKPNAVDMGLQQLAAMTFDPKEAVGLEGDQWVYLSGYLDNAEFGGRWAEGCEALARFGRLSGHRQEVADYTSVQDGTATPQVVVIAHLFQTEAGAKKYMSWVPTASPWICPFCNGVTADPWSLTETPATEPIPEAGPDAVLVRMTAEQGERRVGLVRRGLVVGEVMVVGPPGRPPNGDATALTVKLGDQIDSVDRIAQPYDAAQLLAAPLPLSAWGPEGVGLEWDVNYSGGRDNWEYVDQSPDPTTAKDHVATFGRLVAYQANYGNPNEGPDSPSRWVSTQVMVYRDASSATQAMDDLVGDLLKGTTDRQPATQFDVPGLDGGVGTTFYAGSGNDLQLGVDAYFTHGPSVVRAYMRQTGPNVQEVEAAIQQRVIQIARDWAPRLDQSLGSDD